MEVNLNKLQYIIQNFKNCSFNTSSLNFFLTPIPPSIMARGAEQPPSVADLQGGGVAEGAKNWKDKY